MKSSNARCLPQMYPNHPESQVLISAMLVLVST